MTDFCGPLFEGYFDYGYCTTVLEALNNGGEYTSIVFSTIITVVIGVFIFYKLIDPVRKQRLKWFALLGVLTIIGFFVATFMVNSNIDFMMYLAIYDSNEATEISGENFRFKISLINAFYTIILTSISSLGIKYLSKTNKHNPI